MKEEILKFIEDNKYTYLNFLTRFGGFPYICDYSSEILVGYLHSKFGLEPNICEGNFDGDEDLGHFWIELGDTKIDFTLCQFEIDQIDIADAIRDNTIANIIENNVPFPIITKDNEWYKRLEYLEYKYISDEIIDIAKNNNSFEDYLNEMGLYCYKNNLGINIFM